MIMERSTQCGVCGRTGKRDCPANGNMICTSCCGSKRGNQIDCPPDCTSFPFGTKAYNSWLRVDSSWFLKALNYVIGKIGRNEFKKITDTFVESRLKDKTESLAHGAQAAVLCLLGSKREGAVKSFGEQWKEGNWPGLNNDEIFMSKFRIASLPGVLEIQSVLDDTRMECVDLLDPQRGKFIVFDRNTAARATRFETLLVWLTHYPNFCRLDGAGLILDRQFIEPFLKAIRMKAKVALGSDSDHVVKEFLAVHLGVAFELVAQLGNEMREQMIASMDVNHCRAYYRITGTQGDVEAVLNGKPDFMKDEVRVLKADEPLESRYYNWLRKGEAKEFEKKMPSAFQHDEGEDIVGLLGAVRLSPGELMLETFSRKKFNFAKKLIEKYFGENLEFLKQKVVNLAKQVAEKSEKGDGEQLQSAKVTIPTEAMQQSVLNFHRRHYEKFINDAIPMLDGLTPRQAAEIPGMRIKLVNLMKLHLHGLEVRSRTEGLDLNIDWVLDELNLKELMRKEK